MPRYAVASLDGSGIDPDQRDLSSPTQFDDGVIVQEPTIHVEIDGTELKPTKATVKTNRYAETGTATITGLWQDFGVPSAGSEITVDMNGDRVFTGVTESPKSKGDGSVKVSAYDGVKSLMRTRLNKCFVEMSTTELARTVASNAGIEADINIPVDRLVSPEYNSTPGTLILGQLTKWTNTLWWVDKENVLNVGTPDPTTHIFGPEYIEVDPTAGKKKAPYTKVVVQGESPASQSSSGSTKGGAQASHMLSKNPPVATAGAGQPTYYYESKQIRTQAQAEAAAQAILDEFKRQRATGEVGIVGEGPPVRPLDVIEMPDVLNNERYLVSGINHTFSNGDGLISDVNCGGVI